MSNPTIKQQLDWASETLKVHAIEDPQLEAEVLLAYLLGVDRAKLLTLYNRELETKEIEKLRNYVERRAKREPLQYITGVAHFMSLPFEVTPEVLIPRPETELVVETVIRMKSQIPPPEADPPSAENPKSQFPHPAPIPDSRLLVHQSSESEGGPITILDIGTGSGAIAVSLAHYFPEVTVLGIDIDEKVLRVAKRNAKKHRVQKRCQFVINDLMAYNLELIAYDFIVSNPPYIPTLDIPKLQPELQFEPRSALDGGADGLDYYRKIIPEARKYLKDKGYLVLEVGQGQADAVEKILKQNRYREIKKLRDLNQIERVIYALKWDN